MKTYAERHRFDDAQPFKIDGVYCKLIPLTKGQYAIVWASDYWWLMYWNWCAVQNKNKGKRTHYAVRGISRNGRPEFIYMHRFIMDLKLGDLRQCDHLDPLATLDCRRSNLRVASGAQNMWNQGIKSNNRSGFKGVHFRPKIGKWSAQITVRRKCLTLGCFNTAKEAAAAYEKAAATYHGQFARPGTRYAS